MKDNVILGLKMDALEHDKELAVMKMRLAAVKKERDHDVAASQEGIATLQQRITVLDTLHKSELEGQIAHTRNALICTHHAEKNALIAEFHKEKNVLICTHHDKKTALIAEFNKEKIKLIHQHNNEKNVLIRSSDDKIKRVELALEKDKIVLVGEYKELECRGLPSSRGWLPMSSGAASAHIHFSLSPPTTSTLSIDLP